VRTYSTLEQESFGSSDDGSFCCVEGVRHAHPRVEEEGLVNLTELLTQFYSRQGWFSGINLNGEACWNTRTLACEHIEHQLGRSLTDTEQTVLSLSIGYGPTPSLPQDARELAFKRLWPDSPRRMIGYKTHPPDQVVQALQGRSDV